jgi:hypothetical protein
LPEKKKRKTKLAFLVRGLKISKNGSFAQVEGLLKKQNISQIDVQKPSLKLKRLKNKKGRFFLC